MASKSIYVGLVALIVAAGVNAQALTITPAPDASGTAATTSSTATSTDFSCYINAGPSNTTGALQVMPEPANFTSGDIFCYSAQVPNGTCANNTCTSYSWIYGVADKQGCDSFKEQATLGYYQNVLCCATAQCNKPSASVDSTAMVMTNPDVPTITTTAAADNTTGTTSTAAAGTTNTGGSSSTAAGAATTTTGSTKSTSGAGMTVPGAFVVLCLAAFAIAF